MKNSSKPEILIAAVKLAGKHGLHEFSRRLVAHDAAVGESTVSYHFGTMAQLRTAIVRYAVENKILSILADARTSRAGSGVAMSSELKEKIAAYIAS